VAHGCQKKALGFVGRLGCLFGLCSPGVEPGIFTGYSRLIKLVLTEFSTYKEKRFSILVDGKSFERDCFLLTFANSSQFGNNAVIAPFANVQDNIIDISMIRRFPATAAPLLIYRMMTNSINRSSYFESMKGKEIVLLNKEELLGHIDGEPVKFTGDLTIKMNPLSLKVVVPKKIVS
jgi:diacylglycerol kinase family enzyme